MHSKYQFFLLCDMWLSCVCYVFVFIQHHSALRKSNSGNLSSVVYQTSVGIANPKQKPTILLCGFESNTLLSKLDCAWDLKGSHTIVCKTFSHTGDHTILSLSPNYFPPLICFWNRQVTPSIEGKKEKSSLNGQ